MSEEAEPEAPTQPEAKRWHGLTDEQWLAFFEAQNFRVEITKTLVEVIQCAGLEPESRMSALQILNKAIQLGFVIDETRMYPELVRDTLLAITKGEKRCKAKLAERMHDRLMAVDAIVNTLSQFLPKRPRPFMSSPAAEPMLS